MPNGMIFLIPGARRFVVLDFGKPILLTDLVIPACSDLASLSIDVWVHGEELDGQRLVVSSDIGIRSLIMNDMMPPQICRYLKVCKTLVERLLTSCEQGVLTFNLVKQFLQCFSLFFMCWKVIVLSF